MDFIKIDEFVEWAGQHGIRLDTKHGPPQSLTFAHAAGDSRFWCTRNAPHGELYVIATIMQALDPWDKAWIWKADPAWSFGLDEDSWDPRYVWSGQHLWANIVHGLGIPQDFAGAIRFDRTEFHILMTLLFAQIRFGGCVDDDLFIVPDHARQIVMISHHDVTYVIFAEESRIGSFVDELANNGIELPEHPPDWTFKIPHWMKKQE